MQTIVIQTIPHQQQRYPTVGDYFDARIEALGGGDARHFRISDMDNPDYEFLVTLHELVESHLCQKHGILDAAITAFDKQFEASREEGLVPNDAEPGDDPRAPYHREHRFATGIEKLMAAELGVDWDDYNAVVMGL